MKRQFALARHKYSFYDPLSNVHLTIDKPISKVIDDTRVDVRRLERAVRLGSLIDLTPKPDKTAKKEAATKTVAKAKADEKAENQKAEDTAKSETAVDAGEATEKAGEEVAEKAKAEDTANAETAVDTGEAAKKAGEEITEKAKAKTATKKRATKEK